MPTTLFHYVYADATNTKTYGAIELTGAPKDLSRAICAIAAACDSAELFVAEQVGLPPLQPCIKDGVAYPSGHDLVWHRVDRIAPPVPGEAALLSMSLRTLVRRFRSVESWDIRKSLVGRAQLEG